MNHIIWLKILLIFILCGLLAFIYIKSYKKLKDDNTKVKRMRSLKKEIVFDSILVIIAVLFFKYILIFGYVPSTSMEPTVHKGTFVVVNGLSYLFEEPKRGDIVIFYSEEREKTLIKRIIGLPGDTVAFEDGYVYINDGRYEESYLPEGTITQRFQTFQVPEDCYFVMGDNRENSYDSRVFLNPYIQKKCIKGKKIGN